MKKPWLRPCSGKERIMGQYQKWSQTAVGLSWNFCWTFSCKLYECLKAHDIERKHGSIVFWLVSCCATHEITFFERNKKLLNSQFFPRSKFKDLNARKELALYSLSSAETICFQTCCIFTLTNLKMCQSQIAESWGKHDHFKKTEVLK